MVDLIDRAEAQTEIMMSKNVYMLKGEPSISVSDAVQVLRQIPSVTVQEPTDAVQRTSNANKKHIENTLEDAISRQAALALAKEIHVPTGNAYVYYNHWCIDPQEIIELPPVTVAEKTERWQELKETIIELRDNDGTGTQQEVCKFLANLMDVLEEQMSCTEKPNKSKFEFDEEQEQLDFVQPHKKIKVNLVQFNTPYTDTISRQAAIDAMREETCLSCWDAKYILEHLPSVSTEKTGHWIEQEGYDGDTYYDCSECGESFCLIDGTPTDNLYNYCPNCGAKMGAEE